MEAPSRITIELEPPRNSRERWRARTRVDGALAAAHPEPLPLAIAIGPANDAEPREPAVVPAAYEPPTDCTCVEGFCDADHDQD